MKAYKGFDKNLKCRDFQYEIGGEYTEENAQLCERGFHACEYPLDVFGYYPPTDSRFCEVELDDVSAERKGDSKVCAKHIKISAEIGIVGIVKASVEYIKSKISGEPASTSGYQSAATNIGYRSAATNTGDLSAATNTGDQSAATNIGYRSAATNTGYQSAATNTGDQSAATNTGYRSAATNTGDQSAATNTGYRSAAEVSGRDSVAIAAGAKSKVRGAIGCAIVCVERGEWNAETYPLLAICSAIVDGEKIKADTWYTVKNGEFTEVDDDDT